MGHLVVQGKDYADEYEAAAAAILDDADHYFTHGHYGFQLVMTDMPEPVYDRGELEERRMKVEIGPHIAGPHNAELRDKVVGSFVLVPVARPKTSDASSTCDERNRESFIHTVAPFLRALHEDVHAILGGQE